MIAHRATLAPAAARAFVNQPRGVRANPDGTLTVSSIHHWFREDLGGDEADMIAHLARHAAPPLAAVLARGPRIAGHDDGWAPNDSADASG